MFFLTVFFQKSILLDSGGLSSLKSNILSLNCQVLKNLLNGGELGEMVLKNLLNGGELGEIHFLGICKNI